MSRWTEEEKTRTLARWSREAQRDREDPGREARIQFWTDVSIVLLAFVVIVLVFS